MCSVWTWTYNYTAIGVIGFFLMAAIVCVLAGINQFAKYTDPPRRD